MALVKETVVDKVEVVGTRGSVQVRTATVVKEDGVELSRSFFRHVLFPCQKRGDTWSDTDISLEDTKVQAVCNAVWTEETKTAYKNFVDAQ
jgi:hypothetical protein